MEFHPLLGAALELDKTYRIVIGLKETDGNSMRLRSNLAGAGVCRPSSGGAAKSLLPKAGFAFTWRRNLGGTTS